MGKTYKLTLNDKTYDVEVGDLSSADVEVKVDGESFTVRMESAAEPQQAPVTVISMAHNPMVAPAPLAPRPRTPMPQAGDGKRLTAPMPGVVLAVRVREGEKVKRGEEVCLLESMKMELNILASADGVVKKVCVAQGQNVPHGAVLVEFE